MHITVAGQRGSFSHAAGELYAIGQGFTPIEFSYAIDSVGVLKALTTNTHIDFGIMPIYNSISGLVDMTLRAMAQYNFKIVAKFDMNIEQCIMMLRNRTADTIMTIASHPQALKQCDAYIQNQWPRRQVQEYIDTAQAAKDLAHGILPPTTAVIAPKLCAALYNLEMIAENIQDDPNNYTTFLVVAL